jgi:hypothetical protein
MSSELACLEEIRGRCIAINVNYPDTGVRIRPAVEQIEKSMGIAVKGTLTNAQVSELAEELYSLREYLKSIMAEHQEVKGEFEPTIRAISYLLEPVSK